MIKKLILELDKETYESLRSLCEGNEEAMKKTAGEILRIHFSDKNSSTPENLSKGLEDYLKKGKTGSRTYGIKGQGW